MSRHREAGRALDVEVAERVMGWRWWSFEVIGVAAPCRACYLAEHSIREADRECDGAIELRTVDATRDVPAYSTDIAAAWLVVEKLTGFDTSRDQPWWSVAIFHCQKNQVGCRVYACPPGHSIFDAGGTNTLQPSENLIAESVGNDAPHAICLAALVAVAGEAQKVTT